MKPVIGITGNFNGSEDLFCLKDYYVKAVNNAGGIAIVLPPVQDEEIIREYILTCKGFVFSGGGDIDPVYWGEVPHPKLGEISPLRDSFEINLARQIRKLKIPALGICRGCQILNIAAGGTLIQDIISNMSHSQNAPRDYPFHAIFIERGTYLEKIIKQATIRVNSFHHQAVSLAGDGLLISARASDKTVEAIEAIHHPFFIGVQWHPECLKDESAANLFKALIKACGQ